MRRPQIQHSSFKYPLDEVLGTAAVVRLLRVILFDVNGPVGVTDAARMAGLSSVGARKSMETLDRLGVIAKVGTGRALKFGAREGNPFLPILRELFAKEGEQHEDVFRELRQAVGLPEVRDAWLQNLTGDYSPVLEIVVVANVTAISWIGSELRTRLVETEKKNNLIIEINVFTSADCPLIPDDAIILWGAGRSDDFGRTGGVQTNAESGERSLRMARAIATLIKSDPTLIRRAIRHTERLLHEGQGMANSDIAEWRQLLESYSPERLRDLLVSSNSRADRLRRSSPFFAILTSEERDRMFLCMESEL